ncbi:MAG: secretion protein F [Lachnospiraceae bacterium]|nr:secretion protein F [Lachnospiraceae bacterium]
MEFLMILFGTFFGLGLFFILADVLKLPSLATGKAMLTATKRSGERAKSLESLLNGWAVKLAKYLPMDEYKKIRMQHTLSAAGMAETPEEFTAYALLKSALIASLILPCLLIFPLIAPIVLFLSVIVYFKEIRKADEKLTAKREKIEIELPRFVATITQELKASRDVLSMLEHYKKNSGEDFAKELDIVTADMRSSSYEAALTRFESRLNSPMLSDITRGLIGVLRGDDGGMYFQMLSHDMKQLELQRLKAQAMKIPPKIRVFSFLMLMCFLMMYMVVIVFEIIRSLGGML